MDARASSIRFRNSSGTGHATASISRSSASAAAISKIAFQPWCGYAEWPICPRAVSANQTMPFSPNRTVDGVLGSPMSTPSARSRGWWSTR